MIEMTCFLALFDQAYLSVDHTYWTWKHPRLPDTMLDEFYYQTIAKRPSDEYETILPADLVGGAATVGLQWLACYRILDGGHDLAGRSGRRVVLAAFIERARFGPGNWSTFLKSSVFQSVATAARTTCPLPAPDLLQIACEAQSDSDEANKALQTAHHEWSLPFEGPQSIDKLMARLATLPPQEHWECRFEQRGERESAMLLRTDAAPQVRGEVNTGGRSSRRVSQFEMPELQSKRSKAAPFLAYLRRRFRKRSSIHWFSFLLGLSIGIGAGIALVLGLWLRING